LTDQYCAIHPPMAMKFLLPTWAIKGGKVKRPLEPKEAGSRAMMETANGMVFCEDMMSTAIASFGGNLNSLHKMLQLLTTREEH